MESNKIVIKKLEEDDIMEILIEHFLEHELKTHINCRGVLIGTPTKDLRFIGIYSKDTNLKLDSYDIDRLDKDTEFNGDHAFLKNNPQFVINCKRTEDK